MAREKEARVTIAERLAEVRARIDRAALSVGREPATVTLVAVSKAHPVEAIRQAYAAGQRAFGESYAQELEAKAQALVDLPGLVWHFVGHLQTNKAKLAAKYAAAVHSVDSAALARELGKRAAGERVEPLPVLIEVNVSGEPQKAGVAPSDIEEVMRAVLAQPSLALRGLMTVPPARDRSAAERVFATLRSLRNLHGGVGVLPELSMGMSEDLEIAIACGSTCVRIGTAIFGDR
jgi:pyridoxal phosphate enzyme (YggS family)